MINKNEIKKYLDSRSLDTIGFDVDNTLFQTNKYFLDAWFDLGKELAPLMDEEKDPEEVSHAVKDIILEVYYRDGRKPMLVHEQVISGLKYYLRKEPSKRIKNRVKEYYKHFYIKSPEPFEYAINLIKIINQLKRKIILHSHAQEDWTRVKVELLENLSGVKLPFKFTSIEGDKDNQSWIDAIEMVDGKPENTLVIGDNLESDILSAKDAGCKHLIWIDLREEGLPKDLLIGEDIELLVVKRLEEIPDRLKV
jgi:FMN phosphatase YigB (HAD superfamily)